MVELGITKKPSTGEYGVFWKENGKDDEGKAYCTDYLDDAIGTLFDIESRNEEAGIPTRISTSNSTIAVVRAYNKSFGDMV